MSVDQTPTLPPTGRRALPEAGTGLTRARRLAGFVLAVAALPALTAALVGSRGDLQLATTLLLYLLAVVAVAVVGGVLPALAAAGLSYLLANWFLTPPYGTLQVANRDSVVELLVFVVAAAAVAVTVEVGARRRVTAARSAQEARLMSRFATTPVVQMTPDEVLGQVRELFGLTSVVLVERRDGAPAREVSRSGHATDAPAVVTVAAGPNLHMLGYGPDLFGEDRTLLSTLAQAAGRALEGQRLSEEALRTRELEAVDRLRAALLAAVSHELRTPLAGVKIAISSLRQRDVEWSQEERESLLETVEESTDRLTELIANVLDLSRLESGALDIALGPVAADEAVAGALVRLTQTGTEVVNRVPEDLPSLRADAGLLERILVNLLDNAIRFTSPGSAVEITGERVPAGVAIHIIDRGPGIPRERWDRLFVPFQRLDDRSSNGLGLGLAIVRGFTDAMNGTIVPSPTPGGGLTMTLTLPVIT